MALGLSSCGKDRSNHQAQNQVGPAQSTAKDIDASPVVIPPPPPPDPLRHQPQLAVADRMVVYIDGEQRIVDRSAALKAGFVELDFSDLWTPTIFEERYDENGELQLNRYRKTFLDLADEQSDGNGNALRKNERNFLEVYGIPPSLRIVRNRFIEDADSDCLKSVDFKKIQSLKQLTYRRERKERRHLGRMRTWRKQLKKKMKKAKIESLAAFKPKSKELKKKLKAVLAHQHEMDVLAEIEKRLDCDGHMHRRYKHAKGRLDRGLRNAVRRFQRKHKVYETTKLHKTTMKLMGTLPLETNYLAFIRVLEERIIAATGILEDGTAPKYLKKEVTYTGADGKTYPLRNLLDEYTQAAVKHLGMATPAAALAFFRKMPKDGGQDAKYGIRFPKLPEYYSTHMDLKMVVDRGTVWYDAPYTESGKRRYQRRKRKPRMTLYVRYRDQSIPLVNWPTTIGGWREELGPDGYVYMKYKNSDVGNRVIRKIIAGPTWIPPKTEPLSALVKRRRVNGVTQNTVNYDAMGPGYLSAYGLVAGYFVIPGKNGRPDRDQMIRAHGSSNYMSILTDKYSHGCHRLMNHHAVRLYGFMLRHRNHTVAGDQPISFKRQFIYNDEVYRIHVPSRGFRYTLDPPLPVTVLKGHIKGKEKKRLKGLIPIPGRVYPKPEEPEEDVEDQPLDGNAIAPKDKAIPGATAAGEPAGTPIKIGTTTDAQSVKKSNDSDQKVTEKKAPETEKKAPDTDKKAPKTDKKAPETEKKTNP